MSSIFESGESVLSTVEKIPSKPQEVTPTCKIDRQTSFADTLRAAAQLELVHPGLLAKLALHEPNASTLLGRLKNVFHFQVCHRFSGDMSSSSRDTNLILTTLL